MKALLLILGAISCLLGNDEALNMFSKHAEQSRSAGQSCIAVMVTSKLNQHLAIFITTQAFTTTHRESIPERLHFMQFDNIFGCATI